MVAQSRVEITEEEQREAFAGPAPHVNRFFVTTLGGLVRIAFVEQDPTTLRSLFRSGIVIQAHDAIALRNLLTEMLAPYEEALASLEARDAPAD